MGTLGATRTKLALAAACIEVTSGIRAAMTSGLPGLLPNIRAMRRSSFSPLMTLAATGRYQLIFGVPTWRDDHTTTNGRLIRAKTRLLLDIPTGEPVEDARRFVVQCWQAHASDLAKKTGWKARGVHQRAEGMSHRWQKVPDQLRTLAWRLSDAEIENRPGSTYASTSALTEAAARNTSTTVSNSPSI